MIIITNEKDYSEYSDKLISKWKNIKELEQPKDLYKFYRKHMIELFNDLEPIYGYCISLDLATGKISPEEVTKIYG